MALQMDSGMVAKTVSGLQSCLFSERVIRRVTGEGGRRSQVRWYEMLQPGLPDRN